MLAILTATVTTGIFSVYPAYTDPTKNFEAVIDRGPILEIVVNCHPHSAIMSYGKLDRQFCIATGDCFNKAVTAYSATCK